MFTGVRFNGLHSYQDYGLYLKKRPDIGMPSAKTIFVDVPGSDGSLDLTEAVAGEVKYGNRVLEFTFGAMVDRDSQADFKSRLMDDLHGQIMEIVLDEDPEWYYRGRVSVDFDAVYSWRLDVIVKVDAEPYKRAIDETAIDFDSSDVDDYVEFPLAPNVSDIYYDSRFEFGTVNEPTGDFSLLSRIVISWHEKSPRGDSTKNPKVIIKDAEGNTFEATVFFLNNGVQYTPGYLEGEELDIDKIVSIEVQNVGGATLSARVTYGKMFTFQNERMTLCPNWEVTSDSNVPVLVNGRAFTLSPGTNRNPELLLTRGENILLFKWGQNPTPKVVRLLARKGRL